MNTGFSSIRLKIASPDDILRWSHGEVIKPETINYRTQRPEKDGLFSERIFGPTKDWECYCGNYKRVRYKGVVCDKCGVEVTRSIVRRERMGHISLATPVCHIWFLRSVPSKLSLALDVPQQKLERVIYYSSFIITEVNETNKKRAIDELKKELKSREKIVESKKETSELRTAAEKTKEDLESIEVGKIISETEYYGLAKKFADVFKADSGAEAIRHILEGINLGKECDKIEKELLHIKEVIQTKKLLRRLKLFRSMIKTNVRPEWMIVTELPVLPPDLRPMVPLDGGRYATSDLNDLYRRVINRNNRLKKLLELKAPEVIVVNEKRMLQEAVDSLIDNSARFGTQQLSSQRRPLRSLADMLKGKQGRFRQNLLGKRVDYSARSVIVIGPKLKIDECGLPKKMALELFKPFVISRLLADGLVFNIKNASRFIEQAPPEVWAILEDVIKDRKVLLNRAPTLHRLSVQAFKPILIEGLAIQIPALVCSAFNSDFDGDQMAVHLPLSTYAQREATELMLASKNILKPATGDPIAVPSLDIVLGLHYLTKIYDEGMGASKAFSGEVEVLAAYDAGFIAINAPVKIKNPKNAEGILDTSCGRMIFNSILPADLPYINETQNKKSLSKLIGKIINAYGIEVGKVLVDSLKEYGFEYATRSGVTWSMADMVTPAEKKELVDMAEKEVELIRSQYHEGLLTDAERKTRVIGVWDKTKGEIAKHVPKNLSSQNSIYLIIDSGSRGSWSQPTQMMGMKGLVQNSQGETIELPVKSSLKEGLSVLEYFISTHGARKGSTDTALKTAQAGYLTRRLVDVAQDVIIKEADCRTKEGIEMQRVEGGGAFPWPFASRLFSRTVLMDVKVGNKILIKAGEIVNHELAEIIDASKIESVTVRSPIMCKSLYGICSACYGFDLGNNKRVKTGEAVGIIAAQSIGEPGTQLTMRTFHTGGVAGADITHGLPRVEELLELRPPKGKAILAEDDGIIQDIQNKGLLSVICLKLTNKKGKVVEYSMGNMANLFVAVGDKVKKGDQLTDGNVDLQELFEYKGAMAVERYIVMEVQRIYASEGASINNKHIEVIIRQLFSRVKIMESGDSDFIQGDIIEKSKFLETNRLIKKQGKAPARAKQMLMGITKVALSTESFLSAASFQETARVLVGAASEGKSDRLRGLKENVIIGRLIPVGSGLNLTADDVMHENLEDLETIETSTVKVDVEAGK